MDGDLNNPVLSRQPVLRPGIVVRSRLDGDAAQRISELPGPRHGDVVHDD